MKGLMLDLDAFEGFTPGPWKINGPKTDFVSCGDYVVAQAFGQIVSCETEAEGNARLIAAAPTLLALAKQQREEIERLQKALADQTFDLAYGSKKRVAEAVAAEREACAKIAERRYEAWKEGDGILDADGLPSVTCDVTACENIAAAIRARSTQVAEGDF